MIIRDLQAKKPYLYGWMICMMFFVVSGAMYLMGDIVVWKWLFIIAMASDIAIAIIFLLCFGLAAKDNSKEKTDNGQNSSNPCHPFRIMIYGRKDCKSRKEQGQDN
jgi:hypothetical protein